MKTDKNLLIKNKKTCAIVGNAESIFDEPHGKLIDACDVVVRINKISSKNPEYQGSKTHFVFATPRYLKLIKLPDPLPFFLYVVSEQKEFQTWSSILRKDVKSKKARPSSGFIAIMCMKKMGFKIKLFGFDWYKTNTYYTKKGAWKYHFPQWEKEKIKQIFQGEKEDCECSYLWET